MSDENVEREKAWSEFVSNNGLSYGAEQHLRVAFIGGWVRARASRPREAGKVRVVCEVCDGKGTISIVDHYDDKGESVYAPDECPECEGRLYVERTAYVDAAPNVAPEACPVAWAVVDASGEFWDAAPLLSKDYADKRVATLNRKYGQIVNTPYRVVPLYAQPASATAERGGDVRLFMRACQVLGCGARGVTENAGPWYCAIHHPEHPATPASAAGREGAVEKARQAFCEAARALAEVIDDHCCEPESRSAAKASATCGEREFAFKEAHNALLAAEAAERGEKEA